MGTLSTLDVLMPKTRQRLLGALFGQPRRSWYAAELAKHLGVLRSGVQRDLRALSGAGLLKTYRKGHMVFFQANEDAPVFPELHGLILKTVGLVEALRDVLAPMGREISLAFIYGSIAASREQPDSDIDLLIVGTIQRMRLSRPLQDAGLRLGRQINSTFYSPAEFAKKRKQHFLAAVLDKPKLFVIGTERDLDGITE
ncbi:MAG: helix-turn-helix domain-containing protein [Tepidisphaeraceae bacterium]|jgi:predicted nucleotidyltransferase